METQQAGHSILMQDNLWQLNLRAAYKDTRELSEFLEHSLDELVSYPIFIPRSFALKIKNAGPHSPLWKQFIPRTDEENTAVQTSGMIDPIGDQLRAKGNGIIHRYQNRILFTPTTHCPIQCRYCFRKNELHDNNEFLKPTSNALCEYLLHNPQVNEVIFTGGDPFILSDQKISYYLSLLDNIESIKYIRFHTRTPIIMPERLTSSLAEILSKSIKKIQVVIHTNHKDELSEDVKQALLSWQKYSFSLLSQSVLLKGINDTTLALQDLFETLVDMNIRPYYLHHPDKVKGGMHFYLTIEEGKKIFSPLRNLIPGWALPQYVIDNPEGNGKQTIV